MNDEVRLIDGLLDGSITMDTADSGSLSEIITACLALGRYADLPKPYESKGTAWARLDSRQKCIVQRYNHTFTEPPWNGRRRCNDEDKLSQRDRDLPKITPAYWAEPNVFRVTPISGRSVLLRLDHDGWRACSSALEVDNGGAYVADPDTDLIQAAKSALELEQPWHRKFEKERAAARIRAARKWLPLVGRRGSPIGPTTGREQLVVELAAAILPSGQRALDLLDLFTIAEIESIQAAVRIDIEASMASDREKRLSKTPAVVWAGAGAGS